MCLLWLTLCEHFTKNRYDEIRTKISNADKTQKHVVVPVVCVPRTEVEFSRENLRPEKRTWALRVSGYNVPKANRINKNEEYIMIYAAFIIIINNVEKRPGHYNS